MRLKDKVAIVTGAGRGNGRALALGFSREGARLVVADLVAASAHKVSAEITADGGEALPIEVDVSRRESIEAMVDATLARFGQVDVLVNNAGVMNRDPALELSEAEFDRVIAVNLRGPFLCTQAAARHMQARGGSIINITSSSAVRTPPNLTAYAASKGGLQALTQALAVDLARYRIRVNAICPAVIRTDLNQDRLAAPGVTERETARIPLGRLGASSDLVGPAILLASDESAWMTGTSIAVDGGFLTHG